MYASSPSGDCHGAEQHSETRESACCDHQVGGQLGDATTLLGQLGLDRRQALLDLRSLEPAGRERPVEAVDAVISFDDDTPIDLIRRLKPDVLVKGGDYTKDAVVGAAEVEATGGRVVLVDLVLGVIVSRASGSLY